MKKILIALSLFVCSAAAIAHPGYHGGGYGGYHGGVSIHVGPGYGGYYAPRYYAPPLIVVPTPIYAPRAINNYYDYNSVPSTQVIQINGLWYTQSFEYNSNCNCYREILTPR